MCFYRPWAFFCPARRGWGRMATPPRHLGIFRDGRNCVAPGLRPGAYLWRRPRLGPPAVAAEFPRPARAWRGLPKLCEKNPRTFAICFDNKAAHATSITGPSSSGLCTVFFNLFWSAECRRPALWRLEYVDTKSHAPEEPPRPCDAPLGGGGLRPLGEIPPLLLRTSSPRIALRL